MNISQALQKYYGYSKFRSGQQEIIELILSGKNVLAVLPTGAGKSLCYQIPAIVSENYSIVISPLIALMKDQVDALNKQETIAAFINSSLDWIEVKKILSDISFGKIKLLYVAPERLTNKEFAQRLKELKPSFLFIDEAHCISEWGHNFRPSYTKINLFIEFTGIKKISAFTATATPEVASDIIKQLELKDANLIVKGFERENLFINVMHTKNKKDKCVELLQQIDGTSIIYTSSRKKAEEINEYLNLKGFKSEFYHAGLNNISRKKIQDSFINDEIKIIVATNAFGMGIDKKAIRLVIHYNVPGSIENYYQEIGRAGRDGKDSYVYLLFNESDLQIHRYFIDSSFPKKELIQQIYNGICDSVQIAVGNGYDKDIPVNPDYLKLYTKMELNGALIHSSLSYLESAGYLKINSAYVENDTVKILIDSARLKRFIKGTTNDDIRIILMHLLRAFGNDAFNKRMRINHKSIEEETGLSINIQIQTLNLLHDLAIVEYHFIEGKESVQLLKERISSDKLKLDFKLINQQYLFAHQKLDKLIDFAHTRECRFKYILKYFGENVENYSCGKCDNCLKDQPLSLIYSKPKPQKAQQKPSSLNYVENLELFALLRDQRQLVSRKFMQTPNLICPDEVLAQISKLKPKTKTELLSIKGFHQRMFTKIGEDFLQIIQDFEKNTTENKHIPKNLNETLRLLDKGYTLSEISEARNVDEAIISMQVETILSYLPQTDLSHIVKNEEIEKVKLCAEAGYKDLRELKKKLNDQISIPIIRIALAKIKATS